MLITEQDTQKMASVSILLHPLYDTQLAVNIYQLLAAGCWSSLSPVRATKQQNNIREAKINQQFWINSIIILQHLK